MDAQQIEQLEIRQVKSLQADIGKLLDLPGLRKVLLKTRTFSTNLEEGYNDYAIAVAEAKLTNKGYNWEEATEWDNKAMKVFLVIEVPPIGLVAQARRL